MKILAINKEQVELMSLKTKLTLMGYEVKTETNALAGLQLYKSFKPDLLLLDINMHGFSGLDFAAYVRNVKNDNTPIMVLLENAKDKVITEGFDLGINDYIKKPLNLNMLSARVKKLIGSPKRLTAFNSGSNTLQQYCVGVVVPRYKEEERLLNKEFFSLANSYR